jgi:phage-related protein
MGINLSLIGSNGDVIHFDEVDFVIGTGLRGTGIPVSEVRVTQSAADGATWRSTRKASRDLDVPVTVLGHNRDDVETKLRRLANALSDRYGAPKLRATYDDGASYEIEVHYVSGAETTYGSDAGNVFCLWAMTWTAPDPYWVSTLSSQYSVNASSSSAGLLSADVGQTATLSALRVSSSQALGSLTIENAGDVDAFPVWVIDGPATNVSITLDGVGFDYTETLALGDRITIDTKTASVTDSEGVNKYGFLGSAPKLFRIPPGTSTLSIVAEGAEAATRISGNFNPRREVIF